MFLRLQTQWVVGMSGPIGLNYQSVEFLFRIYEVKDPKALMDDLRDIELGVLSVASEKEKKEGG